jgi:hypothetical protein
MKMNRRIALRTVLIGLLGCMWTSAALAGAGPNCPVNADAEIVATMVKMYAAAAIDDLSTVKSITTADSYAFDAGQRFTFDALMEMIRKVHAAGTVLEWRVTEPEVHVQCDHAWITYINQGAMQKNGERTPIVWFESAQLQFMDGRWQIQFFHSTKVVSK